MTHPSSAGLPPRTASPHPGLSQGFPSIEGLRAYLAWWVVLSHVLLAVGTLSWLPESISKWLVLGDTAVKVFIIASGFVITHLLLGKQEPYGDYLLRRVLRIAPIYVVCLLLAILTAPYFLETFVNPPWGWLSEMRREVKVEEARHWWAHLFAHATMLHGMIPKAVLPFSATSLLGPAWSLSLEWQFYLVAPPLIAFLSRNLKQFLIGTAALLAAGWAFTHYAGDQYGWAPSMLLLAIQWFLVGIGSRLAVEHVRGHGVRQLVLFGAVAAVIAATRSKELMIWTVFYGFALFETRPLRGNGALERVTAQLVHLVATNPVVSTLGKISYSTYLVHIPFLCLVVHLWGAPTQADMVNAMLLGLALLPLVSWLLYKGVEAPFIALGRRLVQRRRGSRGLSGVRVSPGV